MGLYSRLLFPDKIGNTKEQEKEVAAYKEQDEDVLSYALFPQVATEYFKYRDAQEKKVDVTEGNEEAYPV